MSAPPPIPFRRDGPDDPRPGEAVEVAPGVRRLLCRNPGPFTHTGTNTYLIGGAGSPVVVLDPGPDDAAHRAAILRAARGQRVARVLVSHTHRDHSPGARPLAEALGGGVPVAAFGPHLTPPGEGGDLGGDHDFAPDERLADGARVEIGGGTALVALHTPGHCANHLCFALDGAGVLFSADHVMSWSTSVVSPPDGDMGDYVASLARVAARGGDALLLPGHGPPLPEPGPFLAALAAHRLARDARVLDALRAAPGADARALVLAVYGPDLDTRLVGGAARSLLAHLLWAELRGMASRDGADRWVATG